MALSFGVGMPKGDYASSESLFSGGFAHNGFMAEYSGAYFRNKYFGVGGSLKFTSNLTNNEDVASELDKLRYADAPENTQVSYNIGQWNLVSVTAGPTLTYPIGNLNIDAFFHAGANFINQPDMELLGDMGTDGYYSVSLQTNSISFNFDTGLNLRYQLNESTGIRFFISYQQTTAKGDIMQHIDSAQELSLGNYHCKIQLLNTGIGLVYFL